MNMVRGDGTLLEDIDLAPKNVEQEVIQNIAIIIDTIQKSCPMLREIGLPGTLYGRPTNVVSNILISNLYDQIEENEPRAVIDKIEIEQEAATGKLIPIIYIQGVNENE